MKQYLIPSILTIIAALIVTNFRAVKPNATSIESLILFFAVLAITFLLALGGAYAYEAI